MWVAGGSIEGLHAEANIISPISLPRRLLLFQNLIPQPNYATRIAVCETPHFYC